MMAYYPIITSTELRELIPEIGAEIDVSIIDKHIERLQDMKIRPLLKSYSWYDEIMLQISGSSLSTANEYVVNNFLKLILGLYVQQKLILTQTYHLERGGLRIKTSTVSELAPIEDIRYMRQVLQDEIDYLKGEFVKYVCDNSTDYPLWVNDTDTRRATKDYPRQINDFGINISKI